MGAKTGISWTDATWNPIRGCSMAKGSEIGGCLNCYAARLNARGLPGLLSPTTGKPLARILESGPRWTGEVELIEKNLTLPLTWRKPKRIFVNSMSDLFHEKLSHEAIDQVVNVMAQCENHTFQVLTKRAERMLAYMSHLRDKIGMLEFSLPNVWFGVSVEDQATADARIPLLLKTPAAKRFVSYEPGLGPIDFTHIEFRHATWYNALEDHDGWGLLGAAHPKLDWVIVGGESGPGARPFNVEWARSTVRQCREAGVACFVKQMGARPFECHNDEFGRLVENKPLHLKDRKGGDPSEWPEDLRVQEFPASIQTQLTRFWSGRGPHAEAVSRCSRYCTSGKGAKANTVCASNVKTPR